MISIWETICSKPENIGINPDSEGLLNAYPIKNIYNPHDGYGVVAASFTPDNKYFITLGNEPEQTIAIWNWTLPTDKPILQQKTGSTDHTQLKINQKDAFEFMTLGPNSTLFYTFELDQSPQITIHVPIITEKEFNVSHAEYTCCAFHPKPGKAMAGNKDGDLIIFENKSLDDFSGTLAKGEKCAIKYVRVHHTPVTHVSAARDEYLLVGTEDGAVKIFDLNCRILFWFNKLQSGAITSIQSSPFNDSLFDDVNMPELLVTTHHGKSFIVSKNPKSNMSPFRNTTDEFLDDEEKEALALIDDDSRSGNPDVTLILEGHHGKIRAMEVVPGTTKFAVASDTSTFQVWDYTTKLIVHSKIFTHKVAIEGKRKENGRKMEVTYVSKPIGISCIAYSRSGRTLGMGFVNGKVKFMESATLKDMPSSTAGEEGHEASKVGIVKLAFSLEGDYCAAADEEHVVTLFKKETVRLRPDSGKGSQSMIETNSAGGEKKLRARVEWVFIGRRKTHFKPVISLLFSISNGVQTLYSVSKDKHVATYDLTASTKQEGITVKSIRRIDQIYNPESAILCQNGSDEYIMSFNSGMKCKLYSSETQLCRKTSLGPSFTGVVSRMSLIPLSNNLKYFAFTSGNYAGIIGHAHEITNISLAPIGAVLLSAGGTDGVVNMWTMNTSMLDTQISNGGEGMEPFNKMLDPEQGKDGPLFREFEDYFFYAQIKSQGEDVSVERIVGDTVSLDQVPSIMQAMGYYPSKQEIDDMINEVKYGKFVEGETVPVTDINLDDLIKLYLNHRPVFPVSREDLETCLAHAKRLEPGKPTPLGPAPPLTSQLRQSGLTALLGGYGEAMEAKEVDARFKELLMDKEGYRGRLPAKFSANEFIGDILGLE